MKRGSLPSLHALLIFECAARLSNFSRAATELNLTQGAVSHQIRLLEEHMGFPLFSRVRKRVVLTEQGQKYVIEVRKILAELAETTHRARALAGAPTLTLAVVPTFSTYWLMPRVPGLLHKHPDLTIIFRTRLASFDFRGEGVDAAIHNGEPTWAGAAADYLMSEEILPVCSPHFRREQNIEKPLDLARVRLLHLSSRFSAWNDWFSRADLPEKQASQIRGLAFDQYGIMARAAASGAGVALLPRFLVDAEVQQGELEVLFPTIEATTHSYYLVYATGVPLSPMLATFRDWLLDQVHSAADAVIAPTPRRSRRN